MEDNNKEMPLGLAFRLGMNEKALENFAKMTEEEKRQVLEAARGVQSKAEMERFVSSIEHLQ